MTQKVGDPPSSILKDPDGALDVQVSQVQINPQGNTGVGRLDISSGPDKILVDNLGNITANGSKVGNINDPGLIAPITLPSGAVIGTRQEIDGANGVTAERFFFQNGEYKITAANRKPTGANSYLDLNFEELTANAADNATGRKETVTGVTDPATGKPLQLGIPDLLRLEPGDPLLARLQGK
ncbi:MAG: hypothetical protein K2X66_00975 [Cyanobacteria bacterium]|nr:hypothetical protein [Cyanobacteriota bacterium]